MVVLAVVVGLQSRGLKVAPLLGILVAFMTLIGPYMVRNDLRHDMPRLSCSRPGLCRGGSC